MLSSVGEDCFMLIFGKFVVQNIVRTFAALNALATIFVLLFFVSFILGETHESRNNTKDINVGPFAGTAVDNMQQDSDQLDSLQIILCTIVLFADLFVFIAVHTRRPFMLVFPGVVWVCSLKYLTKTRVFSSSLSFQWC